jgi:hypothetical protein
MRREHDSSMRARTFMRLYDREKFGKVGVRTAKLSQFRGDPGTGIATKNSALLAPRMLQARPFLWDVERSSPDFRKMRLAEDERWPGGCRNAQGAPPTVRPIAFLRG